jgi:NAD+ synthase (glutamine-hydrolysing)
MPSCHTSDLSAEIVSSQSKILKIKNYTIPINNIFNCYINSLKDIFKELPEDITEENLQARCRGTLLMAISNKKKLLVLATGNKSELAMGYATLYGDMAGGFCPLADLTKTLVYRLANYRNSISLVISEDAITREPSAELRPNQKDTDSLPPYAILDEIIVKYIEQGQSVEKIIAAGFEAATVKKVIATIELNEYKRRQAPIGPKITSGKDRKSPITKAIFQDIKYQK